MSAVAEIIAPIFAQHADNFTNTHASRPSISPWEDYGAHEQLKARAAAQAILSALSEAGYAVVPKKTPKIGITANGGSVAVFARAFKGRGPLK